MHLEKKREKPSPGLIFFLPADFLHRLSSASAADANELVPVVVDFDLQPRFVVWRFRKTPSSLCYPLQSLIRRLACHDTLLSAATRVLLLLLPLEESWEASGASEAPARRYVCARGACR
eukprot:GHVU01025594.1.p1 GENE.GHVU01025594.1~~GHVU01025594.1.p1  ORF type:complete len:119 (-),score=1.78 GHVU01025594.1:218-574(-)